ncbi:toxin [Streptomyces hygroscopicus]|uniref:toxin n=1 Tax=Streptomyces hygroscopicus TaxID=1912 RepID=UPI001FCB4EC9|nr:toxin [Streptomyces hygroscopicus]BDH10507.1 hypothetical protein HOK021_16860 [Streptomyces hygroscopicus]
MTDKELLRYCVEVVREVDVPEPYDVNSMCDLLEQSRQREISLVQIVMPTGPGVPCGLWVATDDVDYILYPKHTSKAHQAHIASHEIAHILLGHESSPAHQEEVSQLLMPNLNPALVRTVLGRTIYTSQEERAAEMVASLLPMQAGRPVSRPQDADMRPGVANLVSHLERSLERSAGRI